MSPSAPCREKRKEKEKERKERGAEGGGQLKLLARLQLGHLLHVDADALAVEQHKVDGFDGGRHGGHKVAGDGLENQLGRRLLWEAVPGGNRRAKGCRLGEEFGFVFSLDPSASRRQHHWPEVQRGWRLTHHKTVCATGINSVISRWKANRQHLNRTTWFLSPSAADGGKSHRLEFLLVGQSQAVLHRLVQQLLTLVGAPARAVAVDDVLGGQTKTGGQHGCGTKKK